MNSHMKFGDHSLSITLAISKSHSALHYIPHPVYFRQLVKTVKNLLTEVGNPLAGIYGLTKSEVSIKVI